jgi:hypothetical protein
MTHASEEDHNHNHNHNLESMALNYPCPIGRLRILRHNGTKHRENRIREWSYIYLCYLCSSQHIFSSWMETGPPQGGPPHDFFTLSGGRSQISINAS